MDAGGSVMLAGVVGFLAGGYWGYEKWAPMLYYTKTFAKLLVALGPASLIAVDAAVLTGVAMGVGHKSWLVSKITPGGTGGTVGPHASGAQPGFLEVAIGLAAFSAIILGLQWGLNYAEYHWLHITNDYWRFFLPSIVSIVLALL